MSTNIPSSLQGLIVEEEILLSLSELCQACRAREELITAWVMEGVLEPEGARPQEWRFAGHSLRRARLALRLTRDLEVNTAGIAVALDLMDEIATLKAQLRRLSVHTKY
ncbi:MAG: MerR family transcriptional regulator [Rhodocyclales bacterium]|nr:MerR family transcriptional regulator [Rhodocyclales bacterium]